MSNVVRTLLSLSLALVIALPLTAGEQKKPKKGPKPHDPAAQVLEKLAKAELNDDQVAKIKEMGAKCAEKCAAAHTKANLTPDQMKARKEAMEKAKADGKTGKDAQAAVDAAVQLTDDQKAALKEVQEAHGALMKEALGLLTPEQKDKAGIKVGKKPGKKKEG